MSDRPALAVLENVSVVFPQRPKSGGLARPGGLRRVSLTLAPGDRLAVLGRNGSGKTTLLRTLAGIYAPSAGRRWVVGRTAAILSAASGFEPAATGRQNIYLRGLLLGLTRREIAGAVPGIIHFADLGAAIDAPLASYSSGMALRLAFGICTSVRPDVLIFDEWLGVGDAAFIDAAEARLSAMLSEARIMVLATHAESLARRFCNRALIIEGGEVVMEGSVEAAIALYREMSAFARATAAARPA